MTGKYCAVPGCKNSQSHVRKWKTEICQIHEGMLQKDCPCLIPYKLHIFPTDLELKLKWIQAINRSGYVPPKSAAICSDHFVDGFPTTQNPVPLLKMGELITPDICTPTEGRSVKREIIIENNVQTGPGKIRLLEAVPTCTSTMQRSLDESKIEQLVKILAGGRNAGVIKYIIKKDVNMKSAECQTDLVLDLDPISMEDITKDHMYSRQPVFSAKNPQQPGKNFSAQTDFPTFTAKSMDESACRFYTGLNINVFWKLVENLTPLGNFKFSLSVEDQILMCFMRLKLGLLFEDLARRFSVSLSLVSNIFKSWMPKMAEYFNDLVSFLPRDTIRESLPISFQHCFSATTCIVDIFDISLNQTVMIRDKPQTSQNTKVNESVKFLTGIAPHGYIMFISKCYDGTNINSYIAKDCGFLDHIVPGDEVIAESNLDIETDLLMRVAKVYSPEYVKAKMVVCEQKCRNIKTLPGKSQHLRLQVEGAISRMKGFHILRNSTSFKTDYCNLHNILIVVGALCNLQLAIMNFLEKNTI